MSSLVTFLSAIERFLGGSARLLGRGLVRLARGLASLGAGLLSALAALPRNVRRGAGLAVLALAILAGVWSLRDGLVNWYEAAFDRRPLLRAQSWYYHLDKIDVDEIAKVPADLIVMDHAKNGGRVPLSRAEVERIKVRPDGTRRLVVAYMSIGEAEEYRWYWKPEWTKQADKTKMPAWHVMENCAWPGAHAVRFWHQEWKTLMYRGRDSYLGRAAVAGFDGVYLDRVDIYTRFTQERAGVEGEMVDFIIELAREMRKINPNFLVIPQNAEDLLLHKRYRRVIDGLGKEDLLHGHDGTGVRNKPVDIAWSYDRIKVLQRDHKPTFAVEYLVTRQAIAEAKLELLRLGIVGTNAHRNLDGSDPTMPRFEKSAAEGTPEYIKANCNESNSW